MGLTATFTLEPIAVWESKSGKHYVRLFSDGVAAWYSSPGAGGSLGNVDDSTAIAMLQAKVDGGYFLPDAAKTPMRRTK